MNPRAVKAEVLPTTHFQRFSRLAVALPFLTILLIALGGIVRTTGAGLACPDFPLCHGAWLPETTNYLISLQVFHRLGALLATAAAILAMAVVTAYAARPREAEAPLALLEAHAA